LYFSQGERDVTGDAMLRLGVLKLRISGYKAEEVVRISLFVRTK